MSRLVLSLIAAASALAATPGSAAVILNGDGSLSVSSDTMIGDSYTFNFDGSSDGVLFEGLTSTLKVTFIGISGNNWNFNYALKNTSTTPLTSSSVAGFGFDVDPTLVSSSVSGGFNTVGTGSISNGTKVDACFKNGQGNNCAGRGNIGFGFGETAEGIFILGLPANTENLTFSNFAVRYQGINGPGVRDGSALGVPITPTSAVPEPGIWAMMLLGFGFVGGAIRYAKHKQKLTVAYA